MRRAKETYSATIAKVYADQGYLRKAAQIYRDLLAQNPDQDDVQRALAALSEELLSRPAPSRKELGLLFKEWIHLLGTRKRHKRCALQADSNRVNEAGPK